MTEPAAMLVVDDDENDLRMIAAALPGGGPAPVLCVAHDGVEALDYLYARGRFHGRRADPPGVVLLDLHMPRVNGWEVLRQVKSDATLRLIPVVVFSSSARESDIHHSYELGANAYVVKPIDYAHFRRTIAAIAEFWLSCNHDTKKPGGKTTAAAVPRQRPQPSRAPQPT